MAATVSELSSASGSKTAPTLASISFSRASTRLYCSTQNRAASALLPVHSDCNAMRDVRRSTLTSFASSLSLSILHLSLTDQARGKPQGSSAIMPMRSATPRRYDADQDARAAAVSAAGAVFVPLMPLVRLALGLVVNEGDKLDRCHAYDLRRSRFRQRREERLDSRLDHFEPRQHAVVLQSAEARRVRLGPVPGGVPRRPRDA